MSRICYRCGFRWAAESRIEICARCGQDQTKPRAEGGTMQERQLGQALVEMVNEVETQKRLGFYQGDVGMIAYQKAVEYGISAVELLRRFRGEQQP